MDEYLRAQARYLKSIERRSRAHGVSVTEYLETKTAIFDQPEPEPPPRREFKPSAVQMEDRARQSAPTLKLEEIPLPPSDAIISICVTEPRGRFNFVLEVPNIGEIFVASLRNETGYKHAFIEMILYKFYGQIQG